MVRRNLALPHRFICVTDDDKGIDSEVEIVPLWDDHAELRNPSGANGPNCYRRLRVFSKEAGKLFGPRFVSLDLDCVVTGDLTPLWDRADDFICWGGTHPSTTYNGSMMLMTAGSRSQVWEQFDPAISPAAARAAGCYGSDQGWISYCLGPSEPRWTKADGVYSFRNDVRRMRGLPKDARIVFFHGRLDPWHRDVQRDHNWIRSHYW